ncbi:DNA-binding transcriptional MerR regulator [Enterococcus sp. PF1-24]|uniref:MerR family transcriptional regulator n=1 Tax=unclassified Enterococcus TaxID=2608891 RepID=UPI00247723B1|nr:MULTISPECIES: MerR family transcriptional regulator [unclassified Enterococcus]MDH6365704.1 DNA-binding transcriptional MerR regulator [Enterococcus sp. PFB1-1]MDH6402796.1 DNA-binding transcriptional MerR regulator [Enterococcus sp. PF1-24]
MVYSIKEAADKLKVTKHTLYYYEKADLLPPIARDHKGNRIYTDSDISWIYLICCLRDIHMPIQFIHTYVKLLFDENSSLQNRKEMLLTFQEKVNQDIQKYLTIQQLISKKIAFYDELQDSSNELENCYNYKEDWAHFKKILEESNE